jgi:hypothetical protein
MFSPYESVGRLRHSVRSGVAMPQGNDAGTSLQNYTVKLSGCKYNLGQIARKLSRYNKNA